MRNLPVRLIGILLALHLPVAHAQPVSAPDDAIGRWHFDNPLLYYGDTDTDGNPLYVICEAGRLRASVLVDGTDRHDGQRVRATFASNSARVSSRGAFALSDLDMYAVTEITDRARFYRLFDDDRELRIDVEGYVVRLLLRGARDQVAGLKAACPVRRGR
ncbi:hypothetical protein BW685_12145 [Burkholderia ubonensis]|uniref:Uncharacterized protein n=2 Tax=Burkholderia ubonensis TaxID=101571 RepID=A0A1R1JD99_9BURK|nr:hypothetical protein BW685_12145 [Burkholderia ubonensis]